MNARARANRAKDPEKHRTYQRVYAEKRRRRAGLAVRSVPTHAQKQAKLREKLWRKAGIAMTFERYEELLLEQNHACQICKRVPERTLHVDHCHATQKVRGLLCGECNRGLGNFDDSEEFLLAAVAYLRAA